jgi:processing peptidase subunit beta
MAFKGTKNRSQSDLENMVEQMGMRLDAYTSRESTVYTSRCFASDAGTAVSVLGDILTNPALDSSAVEAERSCILREYQEVNSIPYEEVMDYLHAAAFQNSPLGLTILGPTENIKSITKDDLSNYISTFYTAPRMTLVATGGVDHDQLVASAEKAFGGLSSEDKAPQVNACDFHGFQITRRDDHDATATVAIAFEGASWSSDDYYPLAVASCAVGSWHRGAGAANLSGSPLGRLVAENNLAHTYQSFHTAYSDTGLWGITFEAEHDKLDDMTYGVTQEWVRLATSATDAEINRAKAQLQASILFSLDSNFALNDQIGRQYLAFGRRVTPEEAVAQIEAVDAAKVRSVLSEYVYDKCPAVAGVGPVEQLPDYNRIRYDLTWSRF